MGTDTTARQNTIIWSATGGLILLLISIIGWLVIGKDNQILASIRDVQLAQVNSITKAEQSDAKILASVNQLCDRIGGVEGRVSNLEIFIQMPYLQRKDLFDRYKANDRKKMAE